MQRIEKIVVLSLIILSFAFISARYYIKPYRGSLTIPVASYNKMIDNSIININRATRSRLTKLQGIGPALAERIIDYRSINGPFMEESEIMNIKGIGKKKYSAIKKNITIGESN